MYYWSIQILKKLGDNDYVIDLPKSFHINFAFNIEDLMDYKGLDFNLSNQLDDEPSHEPIFERLSLPPLSNILLKTSHQVANILDD